MDASNSALRIPAISRYDVNRRSEAPRGVEAVTERAVETVGSRNPRVRAQPRIPVPARPEPASRFDHDTVRGRGACFRQVHGPEIAPLIELIGVAGFVTIEFFGFRKQTSATGDDSLAFSNFDSGVTLRDFRFAVEHRDGGTVCIEAIQTLLLNGRIQAGRGNLNVVLLMDLRRFEQCDAAIHSHVRVGQAGGYHSNC